MGYVSVFLISIVVYTVSLYVSGLLIAAKPEFFPLLGVAVTTSLIAMIPYVGGLLSLVALFYLLYSWVDIEPFPDGVLMVFMAWGLRILTVFAILNSAG